MTALEKAARALCASVSSEGRWDTLSASARKNYIKHARAVLMAVREPDMKTIDAGIAAWPDALAPTTRAHRTFTAMIDAILNEEPK